MINLFCIRPKGFNVGNDAIFQGTRHFLYKAFQELDIPADSVNLITLPATAKYEGNSKAGLTAQTIYEINQYGHGVIIGGGNLLENGELDVNLDALKCLETPLMLFSLSRGKVYNRQNRLVDRTDAISDRVIEGLDNKATHVLYRDRATSEYVRNLGCRQFETGGCPTIFLDQVRNGFRRMPVSGNGEALVSIRNPQLMSIPVSRQAQVADDIRAIVRLLRDCGYDRIRLLCHDHRDISFASSFGDLDHLYTGDVYEYLTLLEECSLNVTYRLHSFLPCLAFGRPTIKISYDQRALSLIDTLGYDDWNIDMMQTENVAAAVEDRLSRLPELEFLRQQVASHWDGLRERMESTFRDFAGDVHRFHEAVDRCAVGSPPVAEVA